MAAKRTSVKEQVEIDFVILGDFAQAVEGKLYMLGGGWTIHNAQGFPSFLVFGLGLGFLVPWGETNRQHHFDFLVKGSEGPELARGGGDFEIGREAGTPAGITQRVVVGIAGQLQIPQAGAYEIEVKIGDIVKRVTFEAQLARQQVK